MYVCMYVYIYISIYVYIIYHPFIPSLNFSKAPTAPPQNPRSWTSLGPGRPATCGFSTKHLKMSETTRSSKILQDFSRFYTSLVRCCKDFMMVLL